MTEKRSRSHRDDRYFEHRKKHRPHPPETPQQQRPKSSASNATSEPDLSSSSPSNIRIRLLSLLDQFLDVEAGVSASDAELTHARELQTLLNERAQRSLPSKTQVSLDHSRPEKAPQPPVSAYKFGPITLPTDLPPLPPINETHLKSTVFVHYSMSNLENPSLESYERLEFLGDAYLQIISSRVVYSRFPDLDVGALSELRQAMVRNEKLALFANAYDFGSRIVHQGQEDKDKGWSKILADVFEAYVAAVVLSDADNNGFEIAEKWLTELWAPQLLEYSIAPVQDRDAKNELMRLVGAKGSRVIYRQERPMEMHNGVQKFFMGAYLTGWGYEDEWLGSGEGQNKSEAGMAAATDALRRNSEVLRTAHRKKAEAFPHMRRKLEDGGGEEQRRENAA
jgi:ribonuclease III